MVSILQSLSKTIHLSIAIAILLFVYLFFAGDLIIDQLFWSWLFRYLHVISGVMWIGLLWYFNYFSHSIVSFILYLYFWGRYIKRIFFCNDYWSYSWNLLINICSYTNLKLYKSKSKNCFKRRRYGK